MTGDTTSAVDALTHEVVASFDHTADPRLRELLVAVVHHVHALAREVGLSHDEWSRAITFLTRVGQACTEVRQETILLSDVLGLSMLLEVSGDAEADARATEGTVLGPFHMTQSPRRELGDSIDLMGRPGPLVVRGRVTDVEGRPLAGATVDVWQADDAGFYDVQVPDQQPAGNGRGVFVTDGDGRFWFKTVRPAPYPIPTDGPVGDLLSATSRHPYRPAHIHFIAQAPGHRDLTTHIFLGDSAYLDSDAVFAVRSSLITHPRTGSSADAARYEIPAPFEVCGVHLVLESSH